MQRRLFLLIFVFGMSVFVAANVFDYWKTKPPCCDFSAAFGVPLALGRWGGYVGTMSIDWRGLLADIFIAGIASLVFAFVGEKLLRRRALVKGQV